MPYLDENGISKVATVTGVDMKTAASTTLYTVPAGKTFYPTHVVIREPSASLAGGTSYSFTGWVQAVSLASLTTALTDYIVLSSHEMKYTDNATATAFQITVTTGSTLACTATIDVFGFVA